MSKQIFKKDVPKLRKLFDVFEKNGYILSDGNEDGEECSKKKIVVHGMSIT